MTGIEEAIRALRDMVRWHLPEAKADSAEALLDRIAAHVPQRAKDDGMPLWLHGPCARTTWSAEPPVGCPNCHPQDVPWQPLYVLGEATP